MEKEKKIVEVYHKANRLPIGFKVYRARILDCSVKGMRFVGYEFSRYFSYHWSEEKLIKLTKQVS